MNKKTGLALGGVALVAAVGGTVALSRAPAPPPKASAPSTALLDNRSGKDTTVYVAFGADSQVTSESFEFCKGQPKLVCSFPLKAGAVQPLDTGGKYLNGTFSFGASVGCGSTKAELNLNNPKWYDVVDISLVDGFNVPIVMEVHDATGSHTFEAKSISGNEKSMGVYPNGCDICVAREHPPCGMQPGKDGCKGGTQYKPDVPCQYQGPTMSGGSQVTVRLL
jgi:hypothetical protein